MTLNNLLILQNRQKGNSSLTGLSLFFLRDIDNYSIVKTSKIGVNQNFQTFSFQVCFVQRGDAKTWSVSVENVAQHSVRLKAFRVCEEPKCF